MLGQVVPTYDRKGIGKLDPWRPDDFSVQPCDSTRFDMSPRTTGAQQTQNRFSEF